MWPATIFIAVLSTLAFLIRRHQAWPRTAQSGHIALLAIAHPDDESMFFVPTIAALKRTGYRVHVLCLSKGLVGSKAESRADELKAAALPLGIDADAVEVIDDERLQDGFDQRWDAERISEIVDRSVKKTGASLVISFDGRGVTGHPNHIATHKGVQLYARSQGATQSRVACYQLQSVHAARKFVGSFWDMALSVMAHAIRSFVQSPRAASGSSVTVVVVNLNPLLSHRAMVAHWSQYVWFRALFLAGSRFTWVNTLKLIE